MNVIKAIEGTNALFDCNSKESKCLIQKVMGEAENIMETYLQDKKLYEVAQSKSICRISTE